MINHFNLTVVPEALRFIAERAARNAAGRPQNH